MRNIWMTIGTRIFQMNARKSGEANEKIFDVFGVIQTNSFFLKIALFSPRNSFSLSGNMVLIDISMAVPPTLSILHISFVAPFAADEFCFFAISINFL